MKNYNRIAWESCKLGQDVYTYHFGEQKMVLFGKVAHLEANEDGFRIHIIHIKSGHVVKMFKAKDYSVEETALYELA